MNPSVLIITRHHEFSTSAFKQLSDVECSICLLTEEQASDEQWMRECAPQIAFVDFEQTSGNERPLYRLVFDVCPKCRIILICGNDESVALATELVQCGEAVDYIRSEDVRDPHRVPLLVKNSPADPGFQAPSDNPDSNPACVKAFQTLAELRTILYRHGNKDVVRLLKHYSFSPEDCNLEIDLSNGNIEEEKPMLLEMICALLRRAENYLHLTCSPGSVDAERQLPVRRDSEQPDPRKNSRQLENIEAGTHPRILVVDDDEICNELAKEILENAGFSVEIAVSQDSAMKILSPRKFDLVLMDVHLKNTSGIEVIRSLRKGILCPEIPVIVVTSDRTRDTFSDAIDVDIQGYVIKPYHPLFLIEKVSAVLNEFATFEASP